jgi:phage gpG-like protein
VPDAASVSVDASEIAQALQHIQQRGKNTRDVMRQVSLILVEEVDEMFETSGHGKWEPFSINTKRQRGDIDAAKLLIDTGAMAASIVGVHTQTEAEAFTNDPKAKFHVSDANRTKIPKRDFFDIDVPRVVDEAVDLVLRELTQ